MSPDNGRQASLCQILHVICLRMTEMHDISRELQPVRKYGFTKPQVSVLPLSNRFFGVKKIHAFPLFLSSKGRFC